MLLLRTETFRPAAILLLQMKGYIKCIGGLSVSGITGPSEVSIELCNVNKEFVKQGT